MKYTFNFQITQFSVTINEFRTYDNAALLAKTEKGNKKEQKRDEI